MTESRVNGRFPVISAMFDDEIRNVEMVEGDAMSEYCLIQMMGAIYKSIQCPYIQRSPARCRQLYSFGFHFWHMDSVAQKTIWGLSF